MFLVVRTFFRMFYVARLSDRLFLQPSRLSKLCKWNGARGVWRDDALRGVPRIHEAPHGELAFRKDERMRLRMIDLIEAGGKSVPDSVLTPKQCMKQWLCSSTCMKQCSRQ